MSKKTSDPRKKLERVRERGRTLKVTNMPEGCVLLRYITVEEERRLFEHRIQWCWGTEDYRVTGKTNKGIVGMIVHEDDVAIIKEGSESKFLRYVREFPQSQIEGALVQYPIPERDEDAVRRVILGGADPADVANQLGCDPEDYCKRIFPWALQRLYDRLPFVDSGEYEDIPGHFLRDAYNRTQKGDALADGHSFTVRSLREYEGDFHDLPGIDEKTAQVFSDIRENGALKYFKKTGT